jgi:hypothetical protein
MKTLLGYTQGQLSWNGKNGINAVTLGRTTKRK